MAHTPKPKRKMAYLEDRVSRGVLEFWWPLVGEVQFGVCQCYESRM